MFRQAVRVCITNFPLAGDRDGAWWLSHKITRPASWPSLISVDTPLSPLCRTWVSDSEGKTRPGGWMSPLPQAMFLLAWSCELAQQEHQSRQMGASCPWGMLLSALGKLTLLAGIQVHAKGRGSSLESLRLHRAGFPVQTKPNRTTQSRVPQADLEEPRPQVWDSWCPPPPQPTAQPLQTESEHLEIWEGSLT